jgi:S-adenosylmethionine:tRNA ribosyltransferase-isomerase
MACSMRLSDFDYALPAELITQQPVEPRDAARLLVLERTGSHTAHRYVRDLPTLLRPGDLLVANSSRVLPARVLGRRQGGGGGRAEFLLLRRLSTGRWQALGRPARRLRPGDVVSVTPRLRVQVIAAFAEGVREIQIDAEDVDDADAALLAAGSMPLPPYIRGWLGDSERYQTIFADTDGSAAAPTAGLHFTAELLGRLADSGVDFGTLVLHVGLDTFRPIVHADTATHQMHREWYTLPLNLRTQIDRARARGGRIIAVGTTSVRALESWAATGNVEGWTDLFILPGYRFALVDALITNFHLPHSSLLMLVSAFAGRERVLAAYADAIRERYRFYSFGDAMLIQTSNF